MDVIAELDNKELAWEKHLEENAKCIVGSHAGIYMPQVFAFLHHMPSWHVDNADADILHDGPDHEFYWDTWDYVLSNAYCEMEGKTYRLYQDMDLFIVPDMPE